VVFTAAAAAADDDDDDDEECDDDDDDAEHTGRAMLRSPEASDCLAVVTPNVFTGRVRCFVGICTVG
jgi:hypothetical protein